jgi:hypothetical protein
MPRPFCWISGRTGGLGKVSFVRRQRDVAGVGSAVMPAPRVVAAAWPQERPGLRGISAVAAPAVKWALWCLVDRYGRRRP